MPSQTFSHRATAHVPVEVVWAALQRPETWEAIGGVDRVFDPVLDEHEDLRGFSFESVAGGKRYIGEAELQRREEGRLIAWRVRTSEIRGMTEVALSPHGEETEMKVTLEVESTGLLSSMFFPVIAGAIGKGLPRAVDDFAAGFSDDA